MNSYVKNDIAAIGITLIVAGMMPQYSVRVMCDTRDRQKEKEEAAAEE